MKIEINTSDILGDETTIRDEVIEEIVSALKQEVRKNADSIIRETLQSELNRVVAEKVRELVNIHVDTEFTEVDKYGHVGETTTFRNKIAILLAQQCVYKNAHYSSDRNAFTSAVISVVEKEVATFKKDFNSIVSKLVIQECLDEATKKLKASVGLS